MPRPRTEPCVSRVHLWHVGWAGAWAPGSHCGAGLLREAAGARPVVLAAGMLFWTFPARMQPSGWGSHQAPTPMLPSGTQLYRPQQPHEETWATEDGGPMAAPQQAPLPEPPAPGHLLPEPGFPDADPTQVGAWAGGTWPCTWVLVLWETGWGAPCWGRCCIRTVLSRLRSRSGL